MDSSADSSSSPLAPVAVDGPAVASDEQSPPQYPPVATSPGAPSRVKLMVSYGGRIQPRPHDNTRLSYVGGETKILALDRSARLPGLLAKVASLAPSAPDPLCLKYQLPGEDLDSLVSVTDDDDLEHMMVEYDRLQRSNSSTSPKIAARLRLFLFPVGPPPPPPSAALLDSVRADRQWFLDALNAVPIPTLQSQPSPGKMMSSPDFLFGLDEGFVPPPAVKVTVDENPQPENENPPLEGPVKPDPVKDEPGQQMPGGADPAATTVQAAVSAPDTQRQIPELQAAKPSLSPLLSRNGSEETLHRVQPADYHHQPPPPEMAAPVVPQWPDTVGRYASLAQGHDQMVYLLQASPRLYPGFYAAPPRMPLAEAYLDAAAKSAGGGADAYAAAAAAVGGGKLAYDGAGRVVYYASMMPTYQTVTSVALNPVDAAAKPSQIA